MCTPSAPSFATRAALRTDSSMEMQAVVLGMLQTMKGDDAPRNTPCNI